MKRTNQSEHNPIPCFIAAKRKKKISTMESLLSSVKKIDADDIIQGAMAFKQDPVKDKVNLSIGACCNDEGELHYFDSVISAEKIIAERFKSKPVLLCSGSKEFSKLTQELIFGKNSRYVKEKRVCTIQTYGAVGAFHMCMSFLKMLGVTDIYVTDKPYLNHVSISQSLGCNVKYLKFYDASILDINYVSFLEDLKNVPPKSAVLIQPTSYNPCAVNIAEEYFDQIADIFVEKNLIMIFDIAYQGFAYFDLDKDVQLVRRFQERNIYFFVCQSFSKTMALFGERAGALHVVCKNKENRGAVATNFFIFSRVFYNFPTLHTNRLVTEVLGNEKLRTQWLIDLYELAKKIKDKRTLFFEKLQVEQKKYNLNIDWTPYKKQVGLFSFVPLFSEICDDLKEKHIYIVADGRINVSAVTLNNVDMIVDRICQCLKNKKVKS